MSDEPLLIEMDNLISSDERGKIVKALFQVGADGSIESKRDLRSLSKASCRVFKTSLAASTPLNAGSPVFC